MRIQEEQRGAVCVVKADGPLMSDDAEAVKARLLQAIGEHLGRVVLDLSSVPLLDSRGLEVLVEINAEMAESGRALKLCGACPTIRQAMEITGIGEGFDYFEDATGAARSFL